MLTFRPFGLISTSTHLYRLFSRHGFDYPISRWEYVPHYLFSTSSVWVCALTGSYLSFCLLLGCSVRY